MRILTAQLPKAGKVQRGVIVQELRADANQLAQFQADQKLVSAGTVIMTAGTPSSPSSPKVVKTLLIAGVIGLVIGLGLALIREAMDGRIRDADALESRLRAPVLGVIPKFNARSPEKSLATITDPRGAASEAYRMTAITLEHLAARDGLRVIMVASPEDGGGASTTVANLGVMLAQAGHRVILVSADLRYPTLQLIFGLSNGHGFCNALIEGMDPERLLKETQVPNLYVMTSGPEPKDPAALLASPATADVLTTPAGPGRGLHPARDAGRPLGVRRGDSFPPRRRHRYHLERRRLRGPGAAQGTGAARSGGREDRGRDLHVRPEEPEAGQQTAPCGRPGPRLPSFRVKPGRRRRQRATPQSGGGRWA